MRTKIPKIGDIVLITDQEGNTYEEIVISVKNRSRSGCSFYFKEHGRSDSHHWYTLNEDGETWKYSGATSGSPRLGVGIRIIGNMNNIEWFDDYYDSYDDDD